MFIFLTSAYKSENDADFIANLYKECIPWMRKNAEHFMKDEDMSRDVIQDCMLSMLDNIETLRRLSPEQRRAYVCVSLRNMAIRHLKDNAKTVTAFEARNASLEEIASDYSIENEVEKKFKYEAINAAIPYLPERDREILILKFELELSDEEISDIISIKKNSVRMTVRRSTEKLSKIIEEAGEK